jgi:nucleotide-binding universal stress UspA family protein
VKKARRILVGLKEMEHAVTLTDLACRAGARNATLLLVHVIELPLATPLDAPLPNLDSRAEKILRAAERVARHSKMKTRAKILRARLAGQAILDELKEEKIDLAVLGYHHKRSLEEFFLGTTAMHLVKHAPCHILLAVPPRK